jgi:hypothetical protein
MSRGQIWRGGRLRRSLQRRRLDVIRMVKICMMAEASWRLSDNDGTTDVEPYNIQMLGFKHTDNRNSLCSCFRLNKFASATAAEGCAAERQDDNCREGFELHFGDDSILSCRSVAKGGSHTGEMLEQES